MCLTGATCLSVDCCVIERSYMCVSGVSILLLFFCLQFVDWILELFRQCDIFFPFWCLKYEAAC